MKRSILFLLVIVAIANICNAQSYEFKNLDCRYIDRYSVRSKRCVVESLTICDRGAGYTACAKIYNVKESKYVEIPNDTIHIKFTECLRKYTLKDSTGYDFIDLDGNWEIEVRKQEFPNKAYNYISLSGHIKNKDYVYYFTVNLTPEEFEKCRIDEKD